MKATVSYLLMLQKYNSSKQDSEIKDYTMCLGDINKKFTINKIEKQGQKEA